MHSAQQRSVQEQTVQALLVYQKGDPARRVKGQYRKGMVETWDVGEVAGAHGGEGGVYWLYSRYFSASVHAAPHSDPCLQLPCSDLVWALVL